MRKQTGLHEGTKLDKSNELLRLVLRLTPGPEDAVSADVDTIANLETTWEP